MLVHLRHGASVGGHGEPLGVGYTFPRYTGRVLWQGVDAQRRVSFEQVERNGLSRIHGEHNSATLTIPAFTTVRCGAPGRFPPPPELPPRSQQWPSLRALRCPRSRSRRGDLHPRPGCRRWPGPSGCGRYWRCRRKGPSTRVLASVGLLAPGRSERPASPSAWIIR
jgi:hypothetical protein